MSLAIVEGPDFPVQTPTIITYEALALGDEAEGDARAKQNVLWIDSERTFCVEVS